MQEDYPALSGWTYVIAKIFISESQELRFREGDGIAEVRLMGIDGSEDRREPWPKKGGQSPKAKKK